MEQVDKAIVFATKAHKDQKRDSTEIPYILHPLEAGAIAAGIKEDEDIIAAAILHDTIEDTDVTRQDLENNFSKRVVDLVLSDTENKRKELPEEVTWQIRKQETIDCLEGASYDAKIICISDKLANMRAIYRDYQRIGDELWKRFSAPMERQGWYYSSIRDRLQELKDTTAYAELDWLIKQVFNK